MEAQPCFLGLLPRRHVDVVKDLEVVGQELNRDHQHGVVAGVPDTWQQVLEVRLKPLLGGVTGALVGELPALARQAGVPGHQVDGLHQLIDVSAVAVNHGSGQAVRREDERHPAGVWESGQSLDDAVGQLVREARYCMPRSRHAQRRAREVAASGRGQGAGVAAHDDR